MRPHELENWTLRILARFLAHQPIEDDRVELKAAWLDPQRAARRLAAHGNSARGDAILWLIGVDERAETVPGVDPEEFSNSWTQVTSWFLELAPTVQHLNVPFRDVTVAALLADTSRAPFVVRNPAHGAPGGGPVESEVPWREGTAVRSARRSDLLSILSPAQSVPSFEVLSGELVLRLVESTNEAPYLAWTLEMRLYAIVPMGSQVVIPFHHCSASVELGERTPQLPDVEVRHPTSYESLPDPSPVDQRGLPRLAASLTGTQGRFVRNSLTVEATDDEVLIGGPGRLSLRANGREPAEGVLPAGQSGVATVRMRPIGAETEVVIAVGLEPTGGGQDSSARGKWLLTSRG